jgi:hypothetical protein
MFRNQWVGTVLIFAYIRSAAQSTGPKMLSPKMLTAESGTFFASKTLESFGVLSNFGNVRNITERAYDNSTGQVNKARRAIEEDFGRKTDCHDTYNIPEQ